MKSTILMWVYIFLIAGSTTIASAQFPIKIPKIKTGEPPKVEQPASDRSTGTSSNDKPGRGNTVATEPTIAKDFVQITPFTYSVYQKNYDIWSWVPMMSFRVNGPVGSGDQLYAEFNIPGTGVVKFDCRTAEREAENWDDVDCGGRESVPEDKASKYTGVVPFSIKMRNELSGSDKTLFTGKVKIAKSHSNEAQTPKFVNHYVYYADHDWNLPIGYVFYQEDKMKGMKHPILQIAFWVRGEEYQMDPHLFYQGKEVGKMNYEGQEVGKASCEAETVNRTTNYVADDIPQKAQWSRIICTFGNVRGWDKTGEAPGMFGALYSLDKNPGDYEFKLLRNNKLARSIKFNVKSDGSLDNGIAGAIKLNSDRTIVPVQIIGDQDGIWDRNAWKTDAFYGNPLTGFTALP